MKQRNDESDQDYAERRIAALQDAADKRSNELRQVRRLLARSETEVTKLAEALDRLGAAHPGDLTVPGWTAAVPKKRKNVVRPVLMLSDLHLDEVVDLDVMDGFNEYNRVIAEQRLERTINKTVEYLRTYMSGFEIDGIVVALGGDIVTGTIHDELAETNDAPLPDTIQHWTIKLASAISHLADEFGKVYVPCVDGNHDRSGKRYKHKRKAMDAWSWVMYSFMAHLFRDDDRVTFTLSESSEIVFPVYDTEILMVHGDGARGGGGIGGIWPPISRYVHKKGTVYQSQGRPFDICIMGHWHQLVQGANFYVNGSLKGYDEYAKNSGFAFERPQQMLFTVAPERGVTMFTGIHGE